ncbi:hypothetical protein GCM10025859_33830 [Alicyclobacillus fastidiosus]|nr:hypothetical protein GCM10025859_33830 [Alicyclobacillus fastidiosus]
MVEARLLGPKSSSTRYIGQLLSKSSRKAHASIHKLVRRLRRSIKRFNKQSFELTLGVSYVGNADERNLYYQSAHLVARRVAGYKDD